MLIALAAAGVAIALTGQQVLLIAALLGLFVLFSLWKRPHLGILVFLTTFLFTYPAFLQGYGLLTINNVLGAFFFVLLISQLISERTLWAFDDPRIRSMLAISAIFLLSTWFARDPPEGLQHLDRTSTELWDFFTQFAFVIFTIHFIRTRKQLALVFALFLVIIVLTALSALLVAGSDYRAEAVFGIKAAGNSNRLGFYCIVGVAMLWYLRQELASPLARWAAFGLISMLLLVVFMTGSRSALLNTLFLATIIAIESSTKLRRFITTVLVFVALGLLMLQLVPEENLQRSTALQTGPGQHSEAQKSAEGRFRVAVTALEVYADSNPFLGVGPGNFRWIRQLEYDLKRLSLHNGYLWALLSGGIAALTLYLWMYWTCWRDLSKLTVPGATVSAVPSWMVRSTRTMLLLFLMFSLFAEVWLDVAPFLILALTIIIIRLSRSGHESTEAV